MYPATNGNKQQQAASNSEMKNQAFSCCTFVKGKGGILSAAEPNPDELFIINAVSQEKGMKLEGAKGENSD